MKRQQRRNLIKSLIEIVKGNEFKIYLSTFPRAVRGFYTKNDNLYAICIDKALKSKINVLLHELVHIINNDFNRIGNINEIEQKAHNMTKYLRKNIKNDEKQIFLSLLNEKAQVL